MTKGKSQIFSFRHHKICIKKFQSEIPENYLRLCFKGCNGLEKDPKIWMAQTRGLRSKAEKIYSLIVLHHVFER
jgi:hypothetical protein